MVSDKLCRGYGSKWFRELSFRSLWFLPSRVGKSDSMVIMEGGKKG